jgi:hypothetical protein
MILACVERTSKPVLKEGLVEVLDNPGVQRAVACAICSKHGVAGCLRRGQARTREALLEEAMILSGPNVCCPVDRLRAARNIEAVDANYPIPRS